MEEDDPPYVTLRLHEGRRQKETVKKITVHESKKKIQGNVNAFGSWKNTFPTTSESITVSVN